MNATEGTFQKANTSMCAFDILEGKFKIYGGKDSICTWKHGLLTC